MIKLLNKQIQSRVIVYKINLQILINNYKLFIILTMFFKLVDKADNRIVDLRLLIVELKSLKRYKKEFSFDLFALCGFNVTNGKDFLIGAIIKYVY